MTDIPMIVSAGAGAVTGGGLTAWFAKGMINRLIAQHDENTKGVQALKEKNAVLEVRVAEVAPLREEVYKLRERVALAESKLSKAWETIDKMRGNTNFLIKKYKETCGE